MAVKLVQTEFGVGLAFDDAKRGKPYFVDFLSVAWRRQMQKGLPRGHIFRRALGVGKDPLWVVDATAGFGQDSMMILSLGCRVTAIERSPEVAAVLRDGLQRAEREDVLFKEKLRGFSLVEGDAREWLKTSERPDVIYIDPMFDKPKKSAKSPKEMQLLQELLGPVNPGDDLRLLEQALVSARQRVVVKQPLKAKALKASPSHSYKGQSIRYDVYLTS